jgi:hypothetical protein
MQDRDLVAAVVAGEPDGLAEAYDRYAPSLYAYCHSMLPKAEAGEAVQDTFLIAVSRLDGLRDPDRLDAWLHAVARNECLRRLGPGGIAAAAAPVRGSADPEDEPPAVTLPTELRGRVLTACADDSPTGRAHRVSVTHRAGAFGPSGFPKAIGPAGPWWRRVQRRPRLVAAVAVLASLAAAAGITMTMTAGGSQRPQASSLGLGDGAAGSSSSPTPGSVSTASSPTHTAAPSASPPTPSVTMPAGAPSPGPSGRGTPKPSASPVPPVPPPSSPPSASSSPSPSASPSQGYLLLAPDKLLLTSAKGQSASGFFVLTAAGGPIGYYAIEVPAGMASRVTVSPSAGSLPANGYVTVTVTVTSKAALSTDLIVEPGNLTVTVVYKIKAKD